MSIAVAVKHMLAAGMPHEAIVAAVEEMEQAIKPSKSKGAERQARYRERHKASQGVTNRNEASQIVTSDTSPNKESFPHTPFKEINPSKENPPKGGKKKGSRLPESWALSEENRRYAESQGLTKPEIDRQAENFRDYWKSKAGVGGVKLDWDATWRTWVRREADRLGREPKQQAAVSGPNWPKRAQIWRESGGWSEVWGPPPSSPDFNPPPECKHLFERQMSLT